MNFHGEKRTNETHESETDPEAKLMRKGGGKGAKLSNSVHALMENRNGLLVDLRVGEANGRTEREIALQMLDDALSGNQSITLGADRGLRHARLRRRLAARETSCRTWRRTNMRVVARPLMPARRGRRLDDQPAHPQARRRDLRLGKTVATFRRTRFRGKARPQLAAYFVGAALPEGA